MNIQVGWDNDEKTVIRYDYGKGWTWDDFRNAVDTSNKMFAEVEHTVDLIANFEKGTAPPMGALGRFKYAQDTMPKNGGTIVVVGGGFFISTLVSAFSRIYKGMSDNLMVADSLDDARKRISKLRHGAQGAANKS